jgi:hypothetical protein
MSLIYLRDKQAATTILEIKIETSTGTTPWKGAGVSSELGRLVAVPDKQRL